MSRNVQLKICGITTLADRDMVIAAGADFMGVIIDVPSSPRSVSLAEAAFLFNTRQILRVAVLVNPEEDAVAKTVEVLSTDVVQLHGDEPPEFIQAIKQKKDINVWKVLHIPAETSNPQSIRDMLQKNVSAYSQAGVRTFLMDTSVRSENGEKRGGTGQQFDWKILEGLTSDTSIRFFVAGGVNARNIADLLSIQVVSGIDVNSGVELYPGRKDPARIRQLMKEYRRGLLRQTRNGQ